MGERRFNLQLFGGGGGSTEQVRRRDPEPEELIKLREDILKIVSPGMDYMTGDLDRDSYDNPDFWKIIDESEGIQDESRGILDLIGSKWGTVDEGLADHKQFQGDYQNWLGSYQDFVNRHESDMDAYNQDYRNWIDQYQNFVDTGPSQGLLDNVYASINTDTKENLGSMLSGLAGSGVVNSSVADRGIREVDRNSQYALSKAYTDIYNAQNMGYQGVGQNWASLGNQKNATFGALNSGWQGVGNNWNNLGNQKLGYIGQATGAAQGFDQSMLGKYDALMARPGQLWENYYAPGMAGYQFWKDWQESYDRREDYDTVVHQGK